MHYGIMQLPLHHRPQRASSTPRSACASSSNIIIWLSIDRSIEYAEQRTASVPALWNTH